MPRGRMHQGASKWLYGGLALSLLFLCGCAEVTRPAPSGPEQEAAQLDTVRRHPHNPWATERVSRVFIRLLATLPQIHGHTYPFLGFSWWVTANGRVAVDYVWSPSPAKDVGLQPGDLIVAVNNWPLPVWVEGWDKAIRATRNILHDLLMVSRFKRYEHRQKYKRVSHDIYVPMLPGEILAAAMLDLKHIGMEAQGRYLSGPVELLIQRQEEKLTLTLYPQHLPAEYGIMVNPGDRKINAYAAPGRIILTQRLINFTLNDDELALVVGHELAHHAQGHLVRGASHRELGKMVGEIVSAFSTLSLRNILNWRHFQVDPDVRRVAQDAVVSVFSQDDEREADTYGLWYAYQAGYDVDAALNFWERLAAVDDKDPFSQTYFLDSHPAPLERQARLKKVAQYFKAGQAAQIFLQTANLDRQPPPE